MAVATGEAPAWYADAGRWRLVSIEILSTAAIMVVYFWLRGMRPPDVDGSVMRSLSVIRFEQHTGIFQEALVQRAFLDVDWLMQLANWIYAWGHYPVMLAIGLWLAVKDPVRYRFIRNVLLVSACVGLATYWLLPAAPPRLMEAHGYDFGFVDTVHGAASSAHYFQPGPFVNDYAALPSFHFGWIALCSAAIWINTGSRGLRAAAVLMATVMCWAIVVTGNHYFFDIVLGSVVVAGSWMAVQAMSDTRLRPATDVVRFSRRGRSPDERRQVRRFSTVAARARRAFSRRGGSAAPPATAEATNARS